MVRRETKTARAVRSATLDETRRRASMREAMVARGRVPAFGFADSLRGGTTRTEDGGMRCYGGLGFG